ncbi:alanine/glycine:cation symporter family protein [Synechocystis sp. LKSZ1]|uniref:alanine/glycine:cation symporter family protein n=1 Tax=Synechocystis sp. LKSZ1 TaxID=3144951 RepID=UPI00336C24ED
MSFLSSLQSLPEWLDAIFSLLVTALEPILFFSVGGVPAIILWLAVGGLFFSLRLRLVNLFGLAEAMRLGFRSSAEETHEGEVTPFQALTTALSGSIGLGNIAGVAIAIQTGGPGAVFWMTVAAILGMANKFVECSLGVKYRQIDPSGTIRGGPMFYLSLGLGEQGRGTLGQILAIIFSGFGIGAALGGGNMFQANQSYAILVTIVPALQGYDWLYGLLFALLTGLVILGGIGRIGQVTSRLIPLMVIVYFAMAAWILCQRLSAILPALALISQEAFAPQALAGGVLGVFVQGFRRSAFSNNAGLGAAAIAHAVAKTNNPIQEGLVAMLEPLIDTVLVCNLTALVILTTGVYGFDLPEVVDGSALAALAFGSVVIWFPYILAVVILLFAFSTTITWSYYGERCWAYLFGESSLVLYKVLFLAFIFLGAVVNLGAVVDFSDMMLLGMAFPNLLGNFLLSNDLSQDLKQYWQGRANQPASLPG